MRRAGRQLTTTVAAALLIGLVGCGSSSTSSSNGGTSTVSGGSPGSAAPGAASTPFCTLLAALEGDVSTAKTRDEVVIALKKYAANFPELIADAPTAELKDAATKLTTGLEKVIAAEGSAGSDAEAATGGALVDAYCGLDTSPPQTA